MTESQGRELIEAMERKRREIGHSKEKAIAFLAECGILTPEGEFAEHYPNLRRWSHGEIDERGNEIPAEARECTAAIPA